MKQRLNKFVKVLVDSVFNRNTGLFYCITLFPNPDGGQPRTAYVIRRGVRYLWIHISRMVDIALTKDDLHSKIEKLGVDVPWIQGRI